MRPTLPAHFSLTRFSLTLLSLTLLSGALCLGPAISPTQAADTLPALGTDPDSVTVSGFSSGAFMATQMHVALSQTIHGAALFAGGPFGCARGASDIATLTEAMRHCVRTQSILMPIKFGGPPDVPDLVEGAQRLADQGAIDPLVNLQNDRVILSAGSEDGIVPPAVVLSAADWYRNFIPNDRITATVHPDSGHGLPVAADGPVACRETDSPYLNACAPSAAETVFTTFYAPVDAPLPGQSGSLRPFDQTPFIPQNTPFTGLADTGAVFVPDQCANAQAGCRLHAVFHGCRQGLSNLGDQFTTGSGYNDWAATNRVVVLYPQVKAGGTNPNGCWDWWGYSGQAYLTRDGVQIRAVQAMIQRLQEAP